MSKSQKVLLSAVIAGIIPACGILLAVPEDAMISGRTWLAVVVTVVLNAAKDIQAYLAESPT